MKKELEAHRELLLQEKTELENKQEQELKDVNKKVKEYRSQLLSGISSKYAVALERKQIEIESIDRLLGIEGVEK